jgi:glutamine amidotransferase
VIALVDYRAGNLTSVRKAFGSLGAELYTPVAPGDLAEAEAIVVPGVGHFGATRALGPNWMEAIVARVGEGRPLLGICLGMQWLFEGSEEAPDLPGLGLLGGRCYRLRGTTAEPVAVPAEPDRGAGAPGVIPERGIGAPGVIPNRGIGAPGVIRDRGIGAPGVINVKIPHVGWNALDVRSDASIVDGVETGSQVYFTHSFVAPVTGDTVAVTEHGEPFAAIVQRGHVAGVQFHPEKSGDVGLRILRNFLSLVG